MRNPAPSLPMPRSSAVKQTTCCRKAGGLKRGPWTPDEDSVLVNYINRNGEGNWRTLPKRTGLLRCGKSCRLRWMNYLRPSVKHGCIDADEEDLILRLHRLLGNRWSLIAGRIPGRTDNEIKNYWNSHLRKKLISQGIDPKTHLPLRKSPTPTSRRYPDAHNSHHTSHGESGCRDTSNDNLIDAMLGDDEVEDTISSFLNSLMNDQAPFASQNQPAPLPPSNWGNGHQAGWGTW